MNISEVFIRRPIATSLLMLGIAVFGVVAYRALPVADLPSVEYPTISVSASLPGADPGMMASGVASPLERQFTTIAGLDSMTSSSSVGSTQVILQFDLSRDIDSAAVDVQTAIAAVMPLLPVGMPAPPSFRKVNPAARPVISLAILSRNMALSDLAGYCETLVTPQMSMVNGVSQVTGGGNWRFAVRVQVDPDKMKSEAVSMNEVDLALQNWNVNLPTGQLFGHASTYNLKINGQLMNAAQFRPIIVAYHGGRPVRLGDIANVIDSVENQYNLSWFYSKTGGLQNTQTIYAMSQPGSNAVEVAQNIKNLFPKFRSELPPAVQLSIRGDRSTNIKKAFKDLQLTMAIALLLVVGVIFVFLHNTSATLIPALALPFSILGTFAVMELLHFSLDNLSMMALVLSIGFVVDDAIVMLENIVRHLELGEGPLEAALTGSKEIGFTIMTMTVSLAAVFIPILFMVGVLGRLFREFAITVTTAILISGVVSVTLTPMLCSRFLRVAALHSKSGFSAWMDRGFNWLLALYGRTLAVVLRHRPAMLAVFAAVLLATVAMFRIVPKGFIPEQDDDTVNVYLRAALGTSFYQMVDYTTTVEKIVDRNPYVESSHVLAGSFELYLTPRERRSLTAMQIAQQIRAQLAPFPGFRASVTLPAALQVGARVGDSSYNVTVQSANEDDLYRSADRFAQAVTRLPEVVDVTSDLQVKSPRIKLVLDRDKAARFGLDATQIESAMYDGLGPKWSSTIYGSQLQYKVLLELNPRDQGQVSSLKKLSFKTTSGALVPLESVMSFKETVGPQTINHTAQLPSVSISFGLRPGGSLGAAVDAILQLARAALPPTVTVNFDGSAKAFQASMQNLPLLLFVAIGVVYIVLGALYESYVHPLTILSGLPSAGLGALITLWLFGNELNVYSFVGLVMLIGIVKKNAIMQIDFALDVERRQGKAPIDAIYDGCLIRFRPIMMTTMSAILGAVPIAIGFGAGGEGRRPLGLAVVGGLMASQLMTLYLTPVVYTYMSALLKSRPTSTISTVSVYGRLHGTASASRSISD